MGEALQSDMTTRNNNETHSPRQQLYKLFTTFQMEEDQKQYGPLAHQLLLDGLLLLGIVFIAVAEAAAADEGPLEMVFCCGVRIS